MIEQTEDQNAETNVLGDHSKSVGDYFGDHSKSVQQLPKCSRCWAQ